MSKILWVCPCCVHDLASESALQVRNMIASLVERNVSLVCLSSTIRSSRDSNTLHPVARELILHSNSKFQFADEGVQYIYTITEPHSLSSMTIAEQGSFYSEMTPIICGFKPDLVIASSSDIVSMSCLNLAKSLKIPTAFVLLEQPANDFAFYDSDVIISSSQSLIDEYVTPQGKKAVYVGPFVIPNGPLMNSVAQQEVSGEQLKKRKLILMVSPDFEHGLGIFLALYLSLSQKLKQYEFALLETEDNQLLLNVGGYQYQGKKAFDSDKLSQLKLFKVGSDINELLSQTRVLVMPTLSYVSNSSLGLQALSHGVSIITTKQAILKEQLKKAATYIEVDQELIDDMTLAPNEKQLEPWLNALKQALTDSPNMQCFWQALESCDYVKSSRRMAHVLKSLLELEAGNNPQLLRTGAFSLKAILQAEEDAQKRAAQLAAQEEQVNNSALSSYSSLTKQCQQELSTQGTNNIG